MRILIIEDHRKLAENIRDYLRAETHVAEIATDGKEGFERAMSDDFDLIVLDINLPGMDGYVICRMLREQKRDMPILMLTARDTQEDVIRGLNLGADDYLRKPFDLEELHARIRALLRRRQTSRQPILSAGDITVDTNTQRVTRRGREVSLSPKEYALFEFLLRCRGTVQERPRILEHVWGGRDDLLFSQTVDVHVAYLRRKLGKSAIRTVPGRGYLVPAD